MLFDSICDDEQCFCDSLCHASRPSLGWFLDLTTSLAMSSTDRDPESEFSNGRPRPRGGLDRCGKVDLLKDELNFFVFCGGLGG